MNEVNLNFFNRASTFFSEVHTAIETKSLQLHSIPTSKYSLRTIINNPNSSPNHS